MSCGSGACGCGDGGGRDDMHDSYGGGIHLGKPAPMFMNVSAYKKGDADFPKISLREYRGKWVVLFFYPRDFTFICPTEIKGFAAHQKDFADLNAEIIGASTDSAHAHKAWFERDLPEVGYPVLADTTLEIAKAYGICNDMNGEAERGLFIIDPDGIVKYILVSSGSVGRSVKETLRVLKALQTGDLCPMDWEVGEKTLGKDK